MSRLRAPEVIRWGSRDPAAPLIVLFDDDDGEKNLATYARYLPEGAAYASVQVPLPQKQGFAAFREWLDERAAPVPVVLVGFGGGATFAGGLLLADPERFAAAALLYGALPFDTDVSDRVMPRSWRS